MLRQCIEVVGLRRGGGSCIRNLSGTASGIVYDTRLKAIISFGTGFLVVLKLAKVAEILLDSKGGNKNVNS